GKAEQLIIALTEQRVNSDQTTINTIRQSIRMTLDCLDERIDGAGYDLLRLFSAYRDLMLLLGHAQISLYDLFHPALIADPPLKPVFTHLTSQQHETLVRQARTEYQSGLVQWLKTTANQDGLDKMQRAIAQMEKLPGPTAQ